jgi:hypothetical protein
MALSHASWPHHSVQFHPESVATEHGAALLRNFRALTEAHWAATGRGANTAPRWVPPCLAPPVRQPASATLPAAAAGDGLGTRLLWRRLPGGAAVGSEALFWGLFARSKVEEVDTWWLDSASVADGRARFSFMVRRRSGTASVLRTRATEDDAARGTLGRLRRPTLAAGRLPARCTRQRACRGWQHGDSHDAGRLWCHNHAPHGCAAARSCARSTARRPDSSGTTSQPCLRWWRRRSRSRAAPLMAPTAPACPLISGAAGWATSGARPRRGHVHPRRAAHAPPAPRRQVRVARRV